MPGPTLPDVVVLSPHLDDAALALGATIRRLVDAGRRVQVCTVGTTGPVLADIPQRLRPFGDYATRTLEDARALARLGAEGRHLGLREHLWRESRPRGLAAAFRTPSAADGFGELARLTAHVREVLEPGGVVLYAPLGVGHHVDHVEVMLAALAAARDLDALDHVRFYEDYYALSEACRRRHPVTRGTAVGSPGLAAPVLGAQLALTAVLARGPQLDRYAPEARELRWESTVRPVEGYEEAKLAAVGEYRSQVRLLGGRSRLEAVIRRSHRLRGGEVVWRAWAAPRPDSPTPGSGGTRAAPTRR